MKILTVVLITVLATFVVSKAISKKYCFTAEDGFDASISMASNNFSFNIGKQISNEGDGNIVFAPYSIFMALAMMQLGTRGKTQKELISVLNWEGDTKRLEAMREAHCYIDNEKTKSKLLIANEIFVAENYQLIDAYKRTMTEYFNVEVCKEPFGDKPEEARRHINRWISEKTNQKVNELFAPGALDATTVLVLANAIYFKGLWETPFLKESTENGEFLVGGGVEIEVPFMFQRCKLANGMDSLLNVQLLEIPYDGHSYSIVFAMPSDGNINEIVQEMNDEILKRWLKLLNESREEESIEIFIPKFTMSQKVDLNKHLSVLGIQDAFIPGVADFSAMTGQSLYLSKARHESFVQIDEEGTTGAGATGSEVYQMSMPKQVRIDRPFLFFILHKGSSTIMFYGKVMNPLG